LNKTTIRIIRPRLLLLVVSLMFSAKKDDVLLASLRLLPWKKEVGESTNIHTSGFNLTRMEFEMIDRPDPDVMRETDNNKEPLLLLLLLLLHAVVARYYSRASC
jgi:hypothetical protein